MSRLSVLYHLARADLLERVRRYSFLVTLGGAVAAGYLFVPPAGAGYTAGVRLGDSGTPPSYYRGLLNSAWVGSTVALTATVFLSLFGFYLVKNAIERDRHTGVAEIVAATPVPRWLYVCGKWLSNVAVLWTMAGILAATSLGMQLLRGEAPGVDLAALVSPFLWLALPVMALTAALAVLFEMIPWLRGGLGNLAYLFLWFGSLGFATAGLDLFGAGVVQRSLVATAQATFPGRELWTSIGINPVSDRVSVFAWGGVHWTPSLLLGRLQWLGMALGVVAIAAALSGWADLALDSAGEAGFGVPRRRRSAGAPPIPSEAGDAGREPSHLTPLTDTPGDAGCGRLLLAELRLALKGQRWWWYAVALGLVIAGACAPLEASRRILLPAAWAWPVLIWSATGVREARHYTEQLVFSAPHPLRRQFLATWLSAAVVAIVTGGGVALRLAFAGEWTGVLGWAAGALFIPSLAVALGAWSGSSKPFEVVYMLLWYVGPVNGLPALDYMGALSGSVAAGVHWYYLAAALALLALAVPGRRRQLGG